jgi:hypothetical protein
MNHTLLSLTFLAGCSYTIGSTTLSRDEIPPEVFGLAQRCARGASNSESACRSVLSSPYNGYARFQMAMYEWVSASSDRERYMQRKFFTQSDFFDDPAIKSQCPTPISYDGICNQIFRRNVELGRTEEVHAMLDNPDTWKPCYRVWVPDNPAPCQAVYDRHLETGRTEHALQMLEYECVNDMIPWACAEMDKLDPGGAPHRQWTEADAQRRGAERLQERRMKQESEDRAAQERAYERDQQRQEDADHARQQQENIDAVMDAVRDAPGTIQEGVERNKRELDEQIQRQNEVFK